MTAKDRSDSRIDSPGLPGDRLSALSQCVSLERTFSSDCGSEEASERGKTDGGGFSTWAVNFSSSDARLQLSLKAYTVIEDGTLRQDDEATYQGRYVPSLCPVRRSWLGELTASLWTSTRSVSRLDRERYRLCLKSQSADNETADLGVLRAVSRQINKPAEPVRRVERSLSPEAGPSTIPLFNTSVPGRQPLKPDPKSRARGGAASTRGNAKDVMDDDEDDDEDGAEEGMMDDDDDQDEDADPVSVALGEGNKKKKGGLRDKVKAAKTAMKEDDAKSAAKIAGNRRKGPKSNVLGSVDYVKLHEARPGKKKFR